MNVLILTPDAVGSTLLQRLITIYMQFHEFDRPVINLHEITNGIEKYFSPDFGCEIVNKKPVQLASYYQSLGRIEEILRSVDHYKVARLAQYHIRQRQDPVSQQVPFYQYLNQNFFVIACRRHNVFEHALSMTLNAVTKKLNVYGFSEKRDAFFDLYRNKIELDPRSFVQYLYNYQFYLDWCSNYFDVSSYFYYDEHLDHIEQYILQLPIFQQHRNQITWQQKFGIDLDTWNRCHNLTSDLGCLALTNSQKFDAMIEHSSTHNRMQNYLKWPNIKTQEDFESLPAHTQHRLKNIWDSDATIIDHLPVERQQYLQTHSQDYHKAKTVIERMVRLDILPTTVPVKKQTLAEKRYMIKNFDHCLEIYNEWANKSFGISDRLSHQDIDHMIDKENAFWSQLTNQNDQLPAAQNSQQLEYQNDGRRETNPTDSLS